MNAQLGDTVLSDFRFHAAAAVMHSLLRYIFIYTILTGRRGGNRERVGVASALIGLMSLALPHLSIPPLSFPLYLKCSSLLCVLFLLCRCVCVCASRDRSVAESLDSFKRTTKSGDRVTACRQNSTFVSLHQHRAVTSSQLHRARPPIAITPSHSHTATSS